ncbi:hypothetical protein HDU98_004863 [Podochytrium sp. JEL0797]|nr:hypothetical protein HDU98_004863 [Podochytrium sp. JEL0797]
MPNRDQTHQAIKFFLGDAQSTELLRATTNSRAPSKKSLRSQTSIDDLDNMFREISVVAPYRYTSSPLQEPVFPPPPAMAAGLRSYSRKGVESVDHTLVSCTSGHASLAPQYNSATAATPARKMPTSASSSTHRGVVVASRPSLDSLNNPLPRTSSTASSSNHSRAASTHRSCSTHHSGGGGAASSAPPLTPTSPKQEYAFPSRKGSATSSLHALSSSMSSLDAIEMHWDAANCRPVTSSPSNHSYNSTTTTTALKSEFLAIQRTTSPAPLSPTDVCCGIVKHEGVDATGSGGVFPFFGKSGSTQAGRQVGVIVFQNASIALHGVKKSMVDGLGLLGPGSGPVLCSSVATRRAGGGHDEDAIRTLVSTLTDKTADAILHLTRQSTVRRVQEKDRYLMLVTGRRVRRSKLAVLFHGAMKEEENASWVLEFDTSESMTRWKVVLRAAILNAK